jgi:hypothetical protein
MQWDQEEVICEIQNRHYTLAYQQQVDFGDYYGTLSVTGMVKFVIKACGGIDGFAQFSYYA